MTACVECGGCVEPTRECYVIPTCYGCLPPPPPIAALVKEGQELRRAFDARTAPMRAVTDELPVRVRP